ncbi:hypothetical protein [Micromonospora chersina]|uniref:hypothetical protein n=1 Tax=Micromonospora chersina TaxID=47854 RepID=UPI0037164092
MTRRGAGLTAVALRLGLLLGGVALAWCAHEVAAGATAHAAECAPAGPRSAAPGLLPGALRPLLGAVTTPPTSAVSSGRARGATRPAPRDHATAPAPRERAIPRDRAARPAPRDRAARPAPRHRAMPTRERFRPRPDKRAALRPEGRRSAPAARPGPARDDARRSAPDPGTPAQRAHRPGPGGALDAVVGPVRAWVLDPVTGTLRPVTGPLRSRVLGPVGGVRGPATRPVGSGVLTPVTRPLAPGLDPVWRGLKSVREPLGHILKPLKPVTDRPDPPAGGETTPPPATPPPTGNPGTPPLADVGAPDPDVSTVDPGAPDPDVSTVDPGAPAGAEDPGSPTGAVDRAEPHRTNAHRSSQATAATPPAPAGTERPRPVQPEHDRVPAAPVPTGNSAAGSAGASHGDAAIAGAATWTPPALTGHRCRPADGPAPASRSTRPGIRPA